MKSSRCLFVFALLASTSAFADLEIGQWHFPLKEYKHSLQMWDFKYVNFHSGGLRGNITYFTVYPLVKRSMLVTAHLYTADGRSLVFTNEFPLKCTDAKTTSASIDICGHGGIQVLSEDQHHWTFHDDNIEWDLTVVGKEMAGSDRNLSLKLRPPRTDFLHLSSWDMNWVPVFVTAETSGFIKIKKPGIEESFQLDAAKSYHDQNWGRWSPAAQPYRWIHFSGPTDQGEDLHLLLGHFYKNSPLSEGGLSIVVNGKTQIFRGEDLIFGLAETCMAVTQRTPIFKKTNQFVSQAQACRPEGDHPVPNEFVLFSKDGRLVVTSKTMVNDSSGVGTSKIPSFIGDFVINEQILQLDVSYTDEEGRTHKAHGVGEAQFVGSPKEYR